MRIVPPLQQCRIQLTAGSKCVGSFSEGIFLPTAVNDGIFPDWKKVQIKTQCSLSSVYSQSEISLCYVRGEGHFAITAAIPSFSDINAELSHARAELQAAISALDLYIHHIPEPGYSSQMYFMCVTQMSVYV